MYRKFNRIIESNTFWVNQIVVIFLWVLSDLISWNFVYPRVINWHLIDAVRAPRENSMIKITGENEEKKVAFYHRFGIFTISMLNSKEFSFLHFYIVKEKGGRVSLCYNGQFPALSLFNILELLEFFYIDKWSNIIKSQHLSDKPLQVCHCNEWSYKLATIYN